jgi:site-specific DNA-methyltransferase (adenine-specific)/site-specific DNA-methyltransferase (cytosine-N4-specific)
MSKVSMDVKADLYLGDCTECLTKLPDNSVDLIITSPPYADQRKNTYGGVTTKEYVEWFAPISKELLRVLKPTGTFILNIKEKVQNGERSTYVMELILEMRKQGWLWTEEFIWHKKNSYPGKWPNRFRDAWERLLQFNKTKKFNMYQEEVMVPTGDWAKTRLKKLSQTDTERDNSKVNSGFGKNISNWIGRELAYPTNVLHLATECNNKNHSAAFPESLPEWFIKLFTKEGDLVLDPFMGSGTTNIVAQRLYRNSIGIDIIPEYYNRVKHELSQCKLLLCEPDLEYGNKTEIDQAGHGICGTEYKHVPPKPYKQIKNTKAGNNT